MVIGLKMKDSHVRVTHMPTGICAESSNERGQHRNRMRAMEILRARMYAAANMERVAVVVRNYDLPDGVTTLPDASLDDIGGKNV